MQACYKLEDRANLPSPDLKMSMLGNANLHVKIVNVGRLLDEQQMLVERSVATGHSSSSAPVSIIILSSGFINGIGPSKIQAKMGASIQDSWC